MDKPRFPEGWLAKKTFFVLCRVKDIRDIQHVFGFDESTVLECTDLDESVRFGSFDGYDFISLVHMDIMGYDVILKEINAYVSEKYMIMVMPDNPEGRIKQLEDDILRAVVESSTHGLPLNSLLYKVFHILLADYSALLEGFEDNLESLQEQIIYHVQKTQFESINEFRQMAYTIKKQLRAASYLGTQMLVNANGFIGHGHAHYFSNIETRLKKLYDFAESLYELSSQMLYAYDSRVTMKTNEAVNKLTILTIFFGPLTVITGIYGMNFTFMPELGWRLGYPVVLLLMVLITALIYILLKHKKWL